MAGAVHSDKNNVEQVLQHIQELSEHALQGDLGRVLDIAVRLPIECLQVDKSLILDSVSQSPRASANLSSAFLEDCRLLSGIAAGESSAIVEDTSTLPKESARLCASEGVSSLACVSSPQVSLICMRSACSTFTAWEMRVLQMTANNVSLGLLITQDDGTRPLHLERFGKYSEDRLKSDAHPTDLPGMLDGILEDVMDIFQADSGSVMLCEQHKHRVVVCRGLPEAAKQEVHTSRDSAVSSRVIAGRSPVILHGPVDRREWPGAVPRPRLASSISVPLVNQQKAVGLLNVNSSERTFNEQELALASIMGHHLAISIENARLREEAKAQSHYFSDLYRIARTITSTLELDVVLKMIAEHMHRVIACDVCALVLHNPDTGRLELAHGRGIANGAKQSYVDLVMPAAKQAHASRRLVAVPDTKAYKEYADLEPVKRLGLGSGIVAPLTIKRKVVGYIAAFKLDTRGFAQATTRLLLGLAELAAIAIENARLYRRQSGIAHITQRELTPERFEPVRGYEIGSRYTPAHQVGGDYCDLIRINRHKFGLVVADVAGRNVTAALHIAKCKHALRALADCVGSPAKLMHKINRFIYEHTEPEAFISMFYAVLDTRKSTLIYSTAGHEPGLLLRADEASAEHMRTSGILLGIDPCATFEEKMTYLGVDDILFLYTDGLVEALCNGQTDGLEVLERTLAERRLERAQELADNVHRLAMGSRGVRSPDDIAIVTLKKT